MTLQNIENRPISLSYFTIIYLRLFRSAVLRKYKIIVLSDEIYGQLTFSGNHQPLAKVSGLVRLIRIFCYNLQHYALSISSVAFYRSYCNASNLIYPYLVLSRKNNNHHRFLQMGKCRRMENGVHDSPART